MLASLDVFLEDWFDRLRNDLMVCTVPNIYIDVHVRLESSYIHMRAALVTHTSDFTPIPDISIVDLCVFMLACPRYFVNTWNVPITYNRTYCRLWHKIFLALSCTVRHVPSLGPVLAGRNSDEFAAILNVMPTPSSYAVIMDPILARDFFHNHLGRLPDALNRRQVELDTSIRLRVSMYDHTQYGPTSMSMEFDTIAYMHKHVLGVS